MKAWAFIILNLMLMFSNDNILKRRQNKYNLICFIKKEEKNAFLHKNVPDTNTQWYRSVRTLLYMYKPPNLIYYSATIWKQNDSFVLLF